MNETCYVKFHKYAVGIQRPEDICTHDMKGTRNLESLEVSRTGIMKCFLINSAGKERNVPICLRKHTGDRLLRTRY